MAEADEGGLYLGRTCGEQDVLAPSRVCPLLAQRPAGALDAVDGHAGEASLFDLACQAVGGTEVVSIAGSITITGCPGQPAMATGIQPDGSGRASRRSTNTMRVKPYAIRFPSRNARHTALSAPGGWMSTSGCSCRYCSSLRTWSGGPGGTSCTGQYRCPASGQRNGFPKSPATRHRRRGYETPSTLMDVPVRMTNPVPRSHEPLPGSTPSIAATGNVCPLSAQGGRVGDPHRLV